MEPCHGFVDGEMRQAELRRAWLGVRAGQCREQLWAGQGVALDPGERDLILRHPEDNGKVSDNTDLLETLIMTPHPDQCLYLYHLLYLLVVCLGEKNAFCINVNKRS